MASYSVEVSRTAEKQLAQLPRIEQIRVLRVIQALADDPRPSGCRKMAGSSRTFRIRVGSYRVIYDIDDHRIVVVVLKLGHRRDVYR